MLPLLLLPTAIFDQANAQAPAKPTKDQGQVNITIDLREWFIRRVNPTFSSAANANRSHLYSRPRVGGSFQSEGGLWTGRFEYQNVSDVFWTHAGNGSNDNSDMSLAWLRYKSGDFSAIGGRQKILLENQRLIGATEWLPMARAFDAGRAMYGPWDAWFGKIGEANTEPQTARVGAVTHHNDKYGTTSVIFKHDRAAAGSIDEYTLDHVASVQFGKTSFDGEAALQGGDNSGKTQQAWAWHVAGHEELPAGFKVSLQADAASGGSSSSTSRTFDNLYPSNHDLYGLADTTAWRNMMHFSALLEDKPGPAWKLSASAHEFYLRDPSDAWYNAYGGINPRPGGAFVDPTGRSGRNLGSEFDLEASYNIKNWGTFSGGVALFKPGSYVQNLSGHSDQMTFFFLQFSSRW